MFLIYHIKEKEAKKRKRLCINRNINYEKRLVVEITNSWHNRFRKLFTRYEKKVENYLGLVELSCSIIIHIER
jgi:transposase